MHMKIKIVFTLLCSIKSFSPLKLFLLEPVTWEVSNVTKFDKSIKWNTVEYNCISPFFRYKVYTYFAYVCFGLLSYNPDVKGCTKTLLANHILCIPGSIRRWKIELSVSYIKLTFPNFYQVKKLRWLK